MRECVDMLSGKLTISIDLELAWGVWDTVTADPRSASFRLLRPSSNVTSSAWLDGSCGCPRNIHYGLATMKSC
jgi:hypothetical protein